MSEMPNCVAGRGRCKMLHGRDFRMRRIREINQNLRNSPARITESNAHIRGLIKQSPSVQAPGTALNVQGRVVGCTIEVDKCIQ